MSNTFKKIAIHLDLLERVKSLTEGIIDCFENREYSSSIEAIQNRERLLNIVFQLSDSITKVGESDSGIERTSEYQSWITSLKAWAILQAQSNEVIEAFLIKEKRSTAQAIAEIFDTKNRHKGYDLSSIK